MQLKKKRNRHLSVFSVSFKNLPPNAIGFIDPSPCLSQRVAPSPILHVLLLYNFYLSRSAPDMGLRRAFFLYSESLRHPICIQLHFSVVVSVHCLFRRNFAMYCISPGNDFHPFTVVGDFISKLAFLFIWFQSVPVDFLSQTSSIFLKKDFSWLSQYPGFCSFAKFFKHPPTLQLYHLAKRVIGNSMFGQFFPDMVLERQQIRRKVSQNR